MVLVTSLVKCNLIRSNRSLCNCTQTVKVSKSTVALTLCLQLTTQKTCLKLTLYIRRADKKAASRPFPRASIVVSRYDQINELEINWTEKRTGNFDFFQKIDKLNKLRRQQLHFFPLNTKTKRRSCNYPSQLLTAFKTLSAVAPAHPHQLFDWTFHARF